MNSLREMKRKDILGQLENLVIHLANNRCQNVLQYSFIYAFLCLIQINFFFLRIHFSVRVESNMFIISIRR